MKLLFVCTGNICRSPTAEAVMRHCLRNNPDFTLDSAGIQSYHIGDAPDPRTQQRGYGHLSLGRAEEWWCNESAPNPSLVSNREKNRGFLKI